jgi:hypothetical protein
MVVSQNCMDVPGSCSEIYHENEVIDIKVEVTEKEEEEDPLLITFPVIEAQHGVSCMSVCTLQGTFLRYLELPIVFLMSICLSIYMKELHCGK